MSSSIVDNCLTDVLLSVVLVPYLVDDVINVVQVSTLKFKRGRFPRDKRKKTKSE